MKVVLVGVGYWGVNVLRNLQKFKYVKVSVVEPHDERRNNVSDAIPKYKSLSEALSHDTFDCGIVCTNVSSHYVLTKQLLENRIHTLCQKPLVETVNEAQELTELARKNNVKLQCAYTYVYHPAIRKISELSPEIGKKYYYDSTRINLGIIQRDVSVLWDLFCHDAAILYYLTFKLPLYVSATGQSHNKNGLIDVANISMEFDDFQSHVHTNWLSPIKNRTIILAGDKKMVTFDDCSNEKIKIYDTGFSPKGDVFDYRTGDIVIPKIENKEAVQLELEHFFESVQYNMEPLTNGKFSIAVLEMIEAADKSIKLNGQPVFL